jgi:hypothetical protein
VIFLFPSGFPAIPKIAWSSTIRPVSFAAAPRERPCGACSEGKNKLRMRQEIPLSDAKLADVDGC